MEISLERFLVTVAWTSLAHFQSLTLKVTRTGEIPDESRRQLVIFILVRYAKVRL